MSNARAPKLRCGICNGSEFIEAVDHAGQHYIGCARCVLVADPRPPISAQSVHALMGLIAGHEHLLKDMLGSEAVARLSYLLGECYAARELSAPRVTLPKKQRARRAVGSKRK